ncbi:MAG: dipeptide epimerase [Bacteroidetes bacterium]|nr:dipeptide epimerase [Bacteroidota bacterium]
MKLSFVPHILKFKRPFSIAHGSRDSTPVVFTRLEHKGFSGYGEASVPPYIGETLETVLKFLGKVEKHFSECVPSEQKLSNLNDIEMILAEVDKIEKGNNAAKASVDIALHDLLGKFLNKPCHEIFGVDINKNLFTAYTIPIDNPKGIRERIEEAKKYKLLKVKLGSSDDKKIIEEIQKHTKKEFFVDANEGWTDKHFALDIIHWLADRKCLFCEQPMPKEQIDDIAWLTENSPVPIIADEAVKRLSDLERTKGIYSGINIKLMKCTGMNEARKMILQARKYGMKIMLGCMSETSCAVSAAAQIAPLVDWIDLDGPLLIKEDYFDGIKFSEGKIILNDLPGIGVKPISPLLEERS